MSACSKVESPSGIRLCFASEAFPLNRPSFKRSIHPNDSSNRRATCKWPRWAPSLSASSSALCGPASSDVRRGLRQHFSVAPWTDLVEVYWSRLGEAYVTPVADDVVGVAILTSARGTFDSHLEAFPDLKRRLRGAPAASAVMGAGPLRQRVRRRVAGRVRVPVCGSLSLTPLFHRHAGQVTR